MCQTKNNRKITCFEDTEDKFYNKIAYALIIPISKELGVSVNKGQVFQKLLNDAVIKYNLTKREIEKIKLPIKKGSKA